MNLQYEIIRSKARRTVVYLHGFMGSAADWRPVMKSLGAGFNHLAVDLPGHGRSLNLPAYDADSALQAVADLLDELEVRQPILLGYSMGGRLALRLALEHARRFKALVLESASPGLQTEEERAARRKSDDQLARDLERSDYGAFLRRWYSQPLFGSLAQHANYDKLLERRRQNDPRELAKALRGMSVAGQPSFWQGLKEIELPALVICGERDEKYRQISQEMQRRNPRLERVVITDSGHNTHFEQTANFARAVEVFLKKISVEKC